MCMVFAQRNDLRVDGGPFFSASRAVACETPTVSAVMQPSSYGGHAGSTWIPDSKCHLNFK